MHSAAVNMIFLLSKWREPMQHSAMAVFIQNRMPFKKLSLEMETERNMAPNPEIAMKDSTAYMVTDILREVLSSGTGTKANVSGLDIAGKTGTTNYPSDIHEKNGLKNTDVPDSWFAGYTTTIPLPPGVVIKTIKRLSQTYR